MKFAISLLLLAFGLGISAQNAFQQELFSTDLVMKYRNDIELSDAQADKVKKVHSGQIEAFNNAKWDLDGALSKLNKQLAETKINEAGAMAQMDKVLKLEESLKRMRLSLMVKVKNMLTAKQQSQLKDLRSNDDLSKPTFNISAINDHPRMVLKIDGDQEKGAQPLYVLFDKDGKKSFVTGIGHILPDDIESVSVLKGSAAFARYGEDGKNGVIEITLRDVK
ncbi:MAG: TonB-dependent SusC/RagA subfamily outer membrane receptor [Neolewinella sp.]|jgi:TonB-dependent SusC/RagA subfamily outer membrane receptor